MFLQIKFSVPDSLISEFFQVCKKNIVPKCAQTTTWEKVTCLSTYSVRSE